MAFVPQKRIVKDVPNSLIDGIVRGKPVIISDVIDFSEVVNNENIGIVFQKGVEPGRINIDKDTYSTLSENAYRYSEIHSIEKYLEVIESAYYGHKEQNKFKQDLKKKVDSSVLMKRKGDVVRNENSNNQYMGNIK